MSTGFLLENVSCRRAGREILHSISLDLREHDVVSILGSSGAGKSSLLRLLNGLDDTSQGAIAYHGKDLREIPIRELRREVGMVFQLPCLFDGTVRDNILFGPNLWGEEFDAEDLLRQVGLSANLIDRPAHQLSVGQQKRVSMARTLANRPRVLLLDEPTANLDATAAGRILELVLSLRDRLGVAVMMVSHLIEDAETVGGLAVVLHDGNLIESGPAEQVLKNPASEITRRFLDGNLESKETD
ncbi:MAG: ATP-binding cassette domain-containing protein [bacterium]